MTRDARACAEHTTGTHGGLRGERGLGSHDRATLEARAPTEAGLRADDVGALERHVVAHLHEVVDLRTGADRGRAEGRAVDRRVRTDADIVT